VPYLEGTNSYEYEIVCWRLAHNSLAIRPNLSRRGVQLDIYLLSGDTEEGAHLFVKCEHVTRPQTDLKLYSVEAMPRNDPLRCSFFRVDALWTALCTTWLCMCGGVKYDMWVYRFGSRSRGPA
jgi:hypothetical protein